MYIKRTNLILGSSVFQCSRYEFWKEKSRVNKYLPELFLAVYFTEHEKYILESLHQKQAMVLK